VDDTIIEFVIIRIQNRGLNYRCHIRTEAPLHAPRPPQP
jgi:hypothetical protein